jgi:hypothetical protein
MEEVNGRVIWPGRAELAAAMRAVPVVVGPILSRDRPQMPLAEDQHPVGDLSPGREHEPFRIGTRSRALGRDFHGLDSAASQERVEGRGELPGSVADQETRKSAAGSPRSIKGLRICWVVHGPSGFAVTPRICIYRESTSITKKQYRRCKAIA